LRRYLDLQMHHQLKHHLQHGKPLFDEGQLQIVAASAQAASTDARRCERESTRFWLLKFLEAQKGQIVSGQVVRERHRRLFVELDETLLVVPLNNAQSLPLGTPVRLNIHQVDARRDAISLRLVEA
jgi:exoribonuclease R